MRLVRETDPLPRLFGLVLPGFVALGWLLLRARGDLFLRVARCPLREWTGLPCPTCGGAHAAVALAGGDPGGALRANPLVTLAALAALGWAAAALTATVAPGLRRNVLFGPRERRGLRRLGVLIVLAGWAWQFVRG